MSSQSKKPLKPVSGTWLGSDYQSSDDWVLTLNSTQKDELIHAAEILRSRGIALEQATRKDFHLPLLAPILESIKLELKCGKGFVLIRGLPIESYSEEECGIIFWGLASYLGVSVSQSVKGDKLGQVIDKGATDRYYTAGGPLVFHTDPVDVVGLLCLKTAQSGGASRIVNARSLHNLLLEDRPDLLHILYNGFINSRRGHGQNTPSNRIPVFNASKDGLESYLLPLAIHQAEAEGYPLSDSESEALQTLNDMANRQNVYLDMNFQPGDIQFLNNRFVFHGRTDYVDYPEPKLKRHLLRVWLMMPDWPARASAMNFHDRTDRHGGGVRPTQPDQHQSSSNDSLR